MCLCGKFSPFLNRYSLLSLISSPTRNHRAVESFQEHKYDLNMIFGRLLRALRRNRFENEQRNELEDDEAFDPLNPFPDPVLVEFRDVIDLHSIPPRQVRAVVEDYLEEARRRRIRWVRIIHGKGVGVQREIVRSILARTPYVAEFRDAPVDAGGWGATVVTLSESE